MSKIRPLMIAPPLIFAGIAAMFFFGLGREGQNEPPTGREGGPAPSVATLESLGPGAPITQDDVTADGVKLVNFWASWCAPCRAEHPNLETLADEGLPIFGINYKDDPEKALAFLEELGNPYRAIGADPKGRTAIEWGVAGVPETYIIDGEGTILMRFAGPITQRALDERIRPVLSEAE